MDRDALIAWATKQYPDNPLIRRAPKTMEEVRLYGKGTDVVVCFSDNLDRPVPTEELQERHDAHVESSRWSAAPEPDPVYDAIEAKVRSVLTEDELAIFIRRNQWTPRG